MDATTNPTDCAVCRKRDRETGQVCDPCHRWLPVALRSIPALADRLGADLIPADDASSERVLVCSTCGLTVPYTRDQRYARHDDHPEFDDPDDKRRHGVWVPRRLIQRPAGPAPSIAPDIIVTGGGDEPGTPIDMHLHDLLAPVIRDGGRPIDTTGDNWVQAITTTRRTVRVDDGLFGFRTVTVLDRRPRVDDHGRRVMIPAGDQIGVVPVAQVLDQEMRAWIDAGAPGSRWRPTPTIPELVGWLDKRLDWACDHYPAMDVFAAAVQRVRGQMMGALGDFDPEAERCDGVPCNRCDLRMLFRRQDGTGDVECQNPDCLKVFTAEQYRDWVRREGAFERGQRDPAEVAELMRAR